MTIDEYVSDSQFQTRLNQVFSQIGIFHVFQEKPVQLDKIREEGYAVSYGERISEALDIGVPIRNYFVPTSLGIHGPEYRTKQKTEEFLTAIHEAKTQIEKNISEELT